MLQPNGIRQRFWSRKSEHPQMCKFDAERAIDTDIPADTPNLVVDDIEITQRMMHVLVGNPS
jgi:hypothetical protein